MAGKYRAQVRIVGNAIRGWLLNISEPREPVFFNLRIDGVLRGMFTAHRPKVVIMRGMPDVDLAFAFEIPIAPKWVTGGIQEIRLEDPADDELDLVLRGALGPEAGKCFRPEQIAAEKLFGGAERVERLPRTEPANIRQAEAEGRWLEACRLWSQHCHDKPGDQAVLHRLEECARRAGEGAGNIDGVKDALDAWHLVAECQPDSERARQGILWTHLTLASETERAGDGVAARAHWNAVLETVPEHPAARAGLRRLNGEAVAAAPAAKRYRGQVKIVGNSIRGWLLDSTQPFDPVAFNLRIDEQLQGMFLARKQKAILMRSMPDVSMAFEFELQMPPDWITGKVQEIRLESPADASLEIVVRAALGPRPREHYSADRLAGEATIGANSNGATQWLSGTEDFGRVLRACTASLREGNFDAARHALKSTLRSDSDTSRRDLANAFALLAREEVSPEVRYKLIVEQIEMLKFLAQSSDRMTQINALIGLSAALCSIGHYHEAADAADLALLRVPNSVKALVAKAKALVPQNAIKDACAVYERVVDIEPHNGSFRTTLRILRALSEEESGEAEVPTVTSIQPGDRLERVLGDEFAGGGRRLPNWVCITEANSPDPAADVPALAAIGSRAGFLRLNGPGPAREYWRREVIQGIVESELLRSNETAGALSRFSRYYGPSREPAGTASSTRGVAVVTSRNGGFKFGGGEHFIESVAEHYAEEGYSPVILGTRPELRGEERLINDVRHVFIEDSAAAFRRFAIENDVVLVHAISGMGFTVAEALRFMNTPFVYGVHFWRELLGGEHNSTYFDAKNQPIARREFKVVLARAAVVYANSRYTQKIIEDSFGARCPIIYSVPREAGAASA